jgi:DNA-binding protein H-NS
MSTLQDLIAQREALDKQIAETKKAARSDAIKRCKELAEAYGLKAEDIFSTVRKARTTGKVPPKYRDPATGKTWTGRGVEPAWIKGKDRQRFLIA